MTGPLLRVDDLHVQPAEHAPGSELRGLHFTLDAGEIHAIICPAGSGTSTVGAALMGSNGHVVRRGTIEFQGDDITDWPTDERSKAGMFLAFQDPQSLPGVSVMHILSQALDAHTGIDLSAAELRLTAVEWMRRLGTDPADIDRHLAEPLSLGEPWRNEMLQMAVLEPAVAILDATGSGARFDALRIAAQGIGAVRSEQPDMAVLLITDHHRLLDEITPDLVHVLVDGRIIASGGVELAARLEQDGFEAFRNAVAVNV